MSTWNPLQTPRTGPPASACARTAAIAGDSAASAPQRRWSPNENPPGTITASAPLEGVVAVPDADRLRADELDGPKRVAVVARAGEDEHADPGHAPTR